MEMTWSLCSLHVATPVVLIIFDPKTKVSSILGTPFSDYWVFLISCEYLTHMHTGIQLHVHVYVCIYS